MTNCICQCAIDEIKVTAREGIVRELMAQISEKERLIAHLERQIDMLVLDLAVARGDVTFKDK